MCRFIYLILICGIFPLSIIEGQENKISGSWQMARVKYSGGGDWYNDPSAVPNLCRFLKNEIGLDVADKEAHVSIMDEELFSYPILFLTGHGKIVLDQAEVERLRTYLLKGGFLYADDDYGMDTHFRQIIKKLFPDRSLIELPFGHKIYHIHFKFNNGLPKIHEHDKKPPQGFGVFDDTGRLMVFYTYETNLSDGWADPNVHKDPPEKREAALRMGANIILWALLN